MPSPAHSARALGRTVVQAVVEHVPLRTPRFDAALAVLTPARDWKDRAGGLDRTRTRGVAAAWSPHLGRVCRDLFWLTTSTCPRSSPRPPGSRGCRIARCFTAMDAHPGALPHDCVDGFLGALLAPARGLSRSRRAPGDIRLRPAPPAALDEGLARLAADLDEGRWDARFGHLRAQDDVDLGYRLLVAEPRADPAPSKPPRRVPAP